MATVMVTGVGGTGPIATVRSLRRTTAHEVVGVDMDPEAAGLHIADEGAVVPRATADAWPEETAARVREFDVDALVPLVDEELSRLPDLRRALDEPLPIVVPRPEAVSLALDKYRISTFLSERGLGVPRTLLASDLDARSSVPFPLIAKPRRGRGSRDVEVLDARDDLGPYLDGTGRSPEEVVLQEYVEGTEYTTSIVATRDDRLLGVVPKEVITKEGNTMRGVTRDAPDVRAACRRLFEHLAPAGPMNAQQIVSAETGDVHTIEINPRFSSTACLTVAAGVDEIDLLVRDAVGESVEPADPYERDLHLVRYTDQLFLPEGTLERRHDDEAVRTDD